MKKSKKLIEQSIMLAIDSISEEIQKNTFGDGHNKINAEAIKLLAEAYDIVHRGKKVHEF